MVLMCLLTSAHAHAPPPCEDWWCAVSAQEGGPGRDVSSAGLCAAGGARIGICRDILICPLASGHAQVPPCWEDSWCAASAGAGDSKRDFF